MMPYVRSAKPYSDFIEGRDVDSAVHREDGAAGYCVGAVAAVHPDDETIDEAAYVAEAEAIRAYNAALPPPAPPSPAPLLMFTAGEVAALPAGGSGPLATAQTILAKADADITAGEVKTLVLIMARYLFRKWRSGWR